MTSQGALLRSSEPMNGAGKRCYEDEKFFRKILNVSVPATTRGLIYDLRNAADIPYYKSRGGGTETEDSYSNWRVKFASIDKPKLFHESLQKHVQGKEVLNHDSK